MRAAENLHDVLGISNDSPITAPDLENPVRLFPLSTRQSRFDPNFVL